MIEPASFGAVRGLSAKEKETDGMYRLGALGDEDVISSFDGFL